MSNGTRVLIMASVEAICMTVLACVLFWRHESFLGAGALIALIWMTLGQGTFDAVRDEWNPKDDR